MFVTSGSPSREELEERAQKYLLIPLTSRHAIGTVTLWVNGYCMRIGEPLLER